VDEDHRGVVPSAGDGASLPDAEQIRAFKAFGRPVTEAEEVVRSLVEI